MSEPGQLNRQGVHVGFEVLELRDELGAEWARSVFDGAAP